MSSTLKTALCVLGSLSVLVSFAQFTSQGHTINYAGGIASGTTYSSEISTDGYSGQPSNSNNGFFEGFAAFNLASATVGIRTRSGGQIISEQVEGILLRIEETGLYDTIDVVTNSGGSFSFNPVFLGNYLINIDSDPEQYVATYFGDAFLWEEADVLELNSDSVVVIRITSVPRETSGEGKVSGTIEEDFGDESGRLTARRRAAKRKCGLRRKTGGGRTQQDGFELIAYGETNNNGEFEFGFLPQGIYRFFVEYPGIPLDESSFVEFEIGPAGVSDDEFVLAAFVTEDGIVVELVLGITDELFSNFSMYPNPTTDYLNIEFDQLYADQITLSVVDMNGNKVLQQIITREQQGNSQLDLSNLSNGQYIVKFEEDGVEKTMMIFRVIKR